MTPAKLHSRLTESSLMTLPVSARWVFLAFIAIAERKSGCVIGTDERLAQRVAVELTDFRAAIEALRAPDPNSSSKEKDGARIVALTHPRGYAIVNYATYQGTVRKQAIEGLNDAPATIDPKRCPTTPAALAVAKIFRRKQSTPWEAGEILAFRKLGPLDLEELELVARYYEAERKKVDKDGKEIGFHRRNLITFLNNYRGEADRAREWARRNPLSAAKPLLEPSAPKAPEPEPEGFRAWFQKEYPQADPATPFHKIPEDIRQRFTP